MAYIIRSFFLLQFYHPSPSYLDPGHRIVISEQQNFARPSCTATSYHPNEFIGLNHVHSRNSVLMPNLVRELSNSLLNPPLEKLCLTSDYSFSVLRSR